jgi:hypothetical protein
LTCRSGPLSVWRTTSDREVVMIRVSVLYANEAGKKFDHDYYAKKTCRSSVSS